MGGEKPTGVVILAVLAAIEGLLSLGGGAMMLSGGAFFGIKGAALPAAFFSAIGGIMIILGLIYLLVAYGLWTLKPWARTVTIILAIIGLLGFPIGTIISIIILWYLFRPEVKEAFGVKSQ